MARYKKKSGGKYVFRRILVVIIVLAVIAGVIFAVKSCSDDSPQENTPNDTSSATLSGESSKKDTDGSIATATIGSTGDIIIHESVFVAAKQGDTYDFTDDYEYVKPYYSKYDLSVANLEVNFAGGKNYSGYPLFNAPPTIADAVKNAGVDLLLTANNHSYDNGAEGFLNTVRVLREKGISYIGTSDKESEKLYSVRDVNGIKIATACYTYCTTPSAGKKALNGNIMKQGTENLVASFDYNNLDEFYADAKNALDDMKSQGAEYSVIYMHWGDEYQLDANSKQKKIAQKLCDMGWDAIIGGHPHVVEPFETLKSANGHETVCIYSMGNSLSNQRREAMDVSIAKQGYTEDGLIFELEIKKYEDGSVRTSNVNILPTWVNYFTANGKTIYRIVPLDPTVADWDSLGVTRMADAKESYARTMKIVGPGLNSYRTAKGLSTIPLTVK
ncbi:MAG: CapA family protein [Clostridiales bacterium]|nr:CapA family protein [Candidatus Equinaster intestinalis]